MDFKIFHFTENRRDYIARVTGIDELHQWFTNIRVVHGGRMDPRNMVLSYPDGSFYIAHRV